MVISFDFDVNLLADFTQDTSVLERAIRRARDEFAPPAERRGDARHDSAIAAAARICTTRFIWRAMTNWRPKPGARRVIVLTDAEDTGSQLRVAGRDRSRAARRRRDSRAADLRSRLVWICGMGNPGPSVARKMADDTGGRVIDVHNEKSLEKAFDEISEELRSQYVLGYYPTNLKRDGSIPQNSGRGDAAGYESTRAQRLLRAGSGAVAEAKARRAETPGRRLLRAAAPVCWA